MRVPPDNEETTQMMAYALINMLITVYATLMITIMTHHVPFALTSGMVLFATISRQHITAATKKITSPSRKGQSNQDQGPTNGSQDPFPHTTGLSKELDEPDS